MTKRPNLGYQDVHHWAYPRLILNATELGRTFRGLDCLQARVDMIVHDASHKLYSPPRAAKRNEMMALIDRHRAHECACWDSQHLIGVNLLSLVGDGIDLGLPCQLVWADREVVTQYIEPRFGAPEAVDLRWLERIVQRHELSQCACQVSWSAGMTMSRQTLSKSTAAA